MSTGPILAMASTPSSGSDPCDATPRVSTSSQTNPLCATQRSSPVGSVTIAASAPMWRTTSCTPIEANSSSATAVTITSPRRSEPGCFAPGKHDRGEARLHVVCAASVEPRAVDAWRPGLGHAARADDVHVRVEHERSAATAAAGNSDHIGAAGPSSCTRCRARALSQPATNRRSPLRRRRRHEIRVGRVDCHQFGGQRRESSWEIAIRTLRFPCSARRRTVRLEDTRTYRREHRGRFRRRRSAPRAARAGPRWRCAGSSDRRSE